LRAPALGFALVRAAVWRAAFGTGAPPSLSEEDVEEDDVDDSRLRLQKEGRRIP
jgi:hypothetical protein